MIEGSYVLQDLDEVLSAQLAGSTASGDELRQPHVVHPSLLFSRAAAARSGAA